MNPHRRITSELQRDIKFWPNEYFFLNILFSFFSFLLFLSAAASALFLAVSPIVLKNIKQNGPIASAINDLRLFFGRGGENHNVCFYNGCY